MDLITIQTPGFVRRYPGVPATVLGDGTPPSLLEYVTIQTPAPRRTVLPQASVLWDAFPPRTLLTKGILRGARQVLTRVVPQALQWQAANTTSGNSFLAEGADVLFVYNSDPVSTNPSILVTVRSYPDPLYGRVGDLTASLAPQGLYSFGPFGKNGWMQPDGNIYVDVGVSNSLILFFVVSQA